VEISCQIAEHLKDIVVCKYIKITEVAVMFAVEIQIQVIRREIASFPTM
jgi:hypothetical protein